MRAQGASPLQLPPGARQGGAWPIEKEFTSKSITTLLNLFECFKYVDPHDSTPCEDSGDCYHGFKYMVDNTITSSRGQLHALCLGKTHSETFYIKLHTVLTLLQTA
jgi:hypothetical protein